MNGITYFKLLNPKYGGDTTKGCALTGAEVDGNFNFLRGYDVESLDLIGSTTLRLKRVNGEIVDVDLENDGIRREVEEISAKTDSISGKVETDTERIRILEDKVRRLEEKNETLERIVNELNVIVRTLDLDNVDGHNFNYKVRTVIDEVLDGDETSVSYDVVKEADDEINRIKLRFGNRARFVANIPGSQE